MMVIAVRVAGVTITMVDPEIPPSVAVMVAFPPWNLTAAEVVLDGELCSKPPQWLAESDDSGFTIAFLTS